MPIYQGTCPEHGQFEVIQQLPLRGEERWLNCAVCGLLVPLDPTSAAFILKGAGFYKPSPKGEDK